MSVWVFWWWHMRMQRFNHLIKFNVYFNDFGWKFINWLFAFLFIWCIVFIILFICSLSFSYLMRSFKRYLTNSISKMQVRCIDEVLSLVVGSYFAFEYSGSSNWFPEHQIKIYMVFFLFYRYSNCILKSKVIWNYNWNLFKSIKEKSYSICCKIMESISKFFYVW